MNRNLRGITIGLIAAACLLMGMALPVAACATGLPDGTQNFTGYAMSGGRGASPDGFFTIEAYVGGEATPSLTLSADAYGAYVSDAAVPDAPPTYFLIKTAGGLGSFQMQSVAVGEYIVSAGNPDFSNVTVEGYLGGEAVFSTVPYTGPIDTFEETYPIDFTPAHGKTIDSFRVYYTVDPGFTHPEFNLISFTIANAEEALGNDATLKAASKVKGQTVSSLGTPGAAAAEAAGGSVTLTFAQASDTSNLAPYITLFEAGDVNVSAIKAVKYAFGASVASFEADAAYDNQAVSDGDFFIVKVVAEDGITTNYYKISAHVISSDAGLASVAGQPVMPGSESGTAGNPKTASVTVANSVAQIALGDIVPTDSNAVVWLSPDSGYLENVPSISLAAGADTPVYIQIDAEDLSTTLFYAVTVYREPAFIGAATVTMTAPAAGAAPQDAPAVESMTNQADYTVTGVTWNGALTPQTKFAAGTVYSATVTLQSKNSKAFQAGSFTPGVFGASSVGATTTAGTGTGNTVSFLVTFPQTDAKQVTGIAVTTQPAKLSYTQAEDGILDLSGMVVTQTHNDGTQDAVAFTDGTAVGYSTNPANGSALTNAGHNGQKVTVTHTASSQWAQTASLAVAPAPTYGIQLTPAGDYTFPTAVVDYGVPPVHTVTVSNTGTGVTGILTVELSGDDAESFQLSETTIPSLAALGSEDFTVSPMAGLSDGTYSATVTVSGGSVSSRSFDVSFTVEPSYGISLDQNMDLDFPAATVGYSAQTPMIVTVSNTGTGATGALTVALSGVNADAFALSKTSISSIGLMGSDTFTVGPKTGLAEGAYFARVTVSGADVGSEQFDISFTVNPSYGIALSPDEDHTFPAAIAGYGEQMALNVTINNVGTGETGGLTVALTGTYAGSFELSDTSIPSIAVSGSADFTVKPVTGLAVGAYDATVTVSGGSVSSRSFAVSFTVDAAPTHIIALSPAGDHAFPAATIGYGPQTAYQVAVNSTGTGDSGALTVALFGTNADAFELSKTVLSAIAPSGSDSFTVAPKTGLAQGDYSATVTVSGPSVTSRSFGVSFTVEPSYGIALNPAADYTFPEASEGYGAQTAYQVTVSNTGTGATGTLSIALNGADADAFELSKTSIAGIAASAGDSFTVAPKTGLAADTYTATVTVSGARVEQRSINLTFKVNYEMSEGTLVEVVSPTTSIIVEGLFAQEAQLIVTPLDSGDDDREELVGQVSEKSAIAAYEVHVEPAEAFRPPLTLTFRVGEKYNGHTVYILHKLGNGNIDIYQPTVANGDAVITVYELSPFLLAIDPAVIISEQPQSVTALIGTTATFTVAAEGLEPFTYQWQRRTSANGQWKDIAGATGPSYTTTTLNMSHNGYAYRVIVTDVLNNSATSNAAVLTVTRSPETGDASQPMVYAALMILFGAAAILMLKRRRPA